MPSVNNAFYDDLGDAWYDGDRHPIALLRAENPTKVAYTRDVLESLGIGPGARVLDVACGAGLVSFPLAEAGYAVEGVDLSVGSIEAAQARVPPGLGLSFRVGDAYALDAAEGSFDAVLLLDMLEHVERPADVLAEAARVVRPGGAVVFHTFNQTPLAWLLAIHGFKVVTPGGPPHIHVYDLFIPPRRLRAMCAQAGLEVRDLQGMHPVLDGAFWKTVVRRRVDPGFRFAIGGPPWVGYIGHAVRR